MIDVDNTLWSWSRINSFYMATTGDGCYLNWFKQYVEGDRGEGNWFSEYGLLLHQTIEKLHKNELFGWDIEDELRQGIANFTYKAPFPKMFNSYKNSLFEFFNPDEFDQLFTKYNIIEAEEEFQFLVRGYKFTGFGDLIAEHDDYGLVIGDYKSSKPYVGDKLRHNIQQLYLYSIPVKEKYGCFPNALIYIYPRESGKKEYVYEFDPKELERTEQFVVDTIEQIRNTTEFPARCSEVEDLKKFFYGNFLCNHRNVCEYKNKIND